jgi:NRPS condensation-like uncharacterized protein
VIIVRPHLPQLTAAENKLYGEYQGITDKAGKAKPGKTERLEEILAALREIKEQKVYRLNHPSWTRYNSGHEKFNTLPAHTDDSELAAAIFMRSGIQHGSIQEAKSYSGVDNFKLNDVHVHKIDLIEEQRRKQQK